MHGGLHEQQQTCYMHTYLHTRTGRMEATVETLSHVHFFAILNLNHCGIESLQAFLCAHLCVCMWERGPISI